MSQFDLETLLSLASRGSLTVVEHRRVRIALHVQGKPVNFSAFSRELDCDRATVLEKVRGSPLTAASASVQP